MGFGFTCRQQQLQLTDGEAMVSAVESITQRDANGNSSNSEEEFQDVESVRPTSSESNADLAPLEAYVVPDDDSSSSSSNTNNTAGELVAAQPYEDPTIHFKKYTRVAWVIACIFLIAIVVSASVVVTNKNNQIEEVESPTVSPTQEQILPNATLILEPVMAQALQEDSESALAAYDWLLKEDEGGILFDYTTPDWRVIQRYIAAYLYFTTGGEGWVLWFFQELDAPSFSFLNATSECEWNARIHFFF
jgi:hypothetical protein